MAIPERPHRGSNTGQHDLQSYALPLSYKAVRDQHCVTIGYRGLKGQRSGMHLYAPATKDSGKIGEREKKELR